MPDRTRLMIAFLCLATSLICSIICGVSAVKTSNFLKTALPTEGVVIEMAAVSGEHGVTYAPVYSFADGQGVKHKGQSGHSSNPPGYKVGDKMTIRYKPQDPASNRPDDFLSLWGMSLITGFFVIIDLPLGLAFLFWPKIQQVMHRRSQTGA